MIQTQFPHFNLEDKVSDWAVGNDNPNPYYVYKEKEREKDSSK